MSDPRSVVGSRRAPCTPPAAAAGQLSSSMPIFQSSTFRFETNEEFARAIRFDGPGYVLAGVRQPDRRCVPVRDGRPGGVGVRDGFASGLAAISRCSSRSRRRGRGWSRGRRCTGAPSRCCEHPAPVRRRDDVRRPDRPGPGARGVAGRRPLLLRDDREPHDDRAGPRGLASLCREAGVLSAVDNTFASPYLCNPVALGFDVALHSATKYVGGTPT